ncbi:hypothetical protein L917_08780 [Phytophthora nicotianae]|uniref:Uncharacterized protein n=1 Tax=Phytophthora nicotianae TaxID=4792 RepID=W2L6B0_PHYNI|nr:hypothetical protein L917_08780 [Phytophthora nicotianae]
MGKSVTSIPQSAATLALSAHVDGSLNRQLRPAVRTQVRPSTSTKGRKFKHRWQNIDPLLDKQPVRSPTSTGNGKPSSYLKAALSTESAWLPPLLIASSEIIRQHLKEDLLRAEVATSRRLRALGFRRGSNREGLDSVAQATLSRITIEHNLDVASMAKLVRGDTLAEPRPNKAFRISDVR